MMSEIELWAEHLHNDDLLCTEAARSYAAQKYGVVYHVADDPVLRSIFFEEDIKANVAKRRSHRAGFLVVSLALFSLGSGAGEPLWRLLNPLMQSVIVSASAAAGVAAVYIGATRILFGSRKAAWLHGRLFTERLRQAHFQSFVCELSSISRLFGADADAVKDYKVLHDNAIRGFAVQLRGRLDAELTSILDPARKPEIWVRACQPVDPEILSAGKLGQLFDAYGDLRLAAQLSYADHKLAEGVWSPNLIKNSLRMQLKQLNYVWGSALLLIVGLHIAVLGRTVFGIVSEADYLIHIVIVWLALLAVAAKTLQEGLGLRTEIARYEQYRSDLANLKTRFDLAESPKDKFNIMIETEGVVYREMRDFLRTHAEVSFIL